MLPRGNGRKSEGSNGLELKRGAGRESWMKRLNDRPREEETDEASFKGKQMMCLPLVKKLCENHAAFFPERFGKGLGVEVVKC